MALVRGVNKGGMDKEEYWEDLGNGGERLWVYMGVKGVGEICDLLRKDGG